MDEVYVIYDSVMDKYVSQTIKIRRSTTPFLAIKFGDVYSAIAFDEEWYAQLRLEEIRDWYSKNFPEKKINLSIRRIYA
jgi:hypothetical protein